MSRESHTIEEMDLEKRRIEMFINKELLDFSEKFRCKSVSVLNCTTRGLDSKEVRYEIEVEY